MTELVTCSRWLLKLDLLHLRLKFYKNRNFKFKINVLGTYLWFLLFAPVMIRDSTRDFSLSSTMISRLIIIKRDEFRLDVLVLYELRFLSWWWGMLGGGGEEHHGTPWTNTVGDEGAPNVTPRDDEKESTSIWYTVAIESIDQVLTDNISCNSPEKAVQNLVYINLLIFNE